MRAALARGLKERKGDAAFVLPALVVAGVAGMLSAAHAKVALAAGLALGCGVVLVTWMRSGAASADAYRWVPVAWVALFLVSDLHFVSQGPLEVASGEIGAQHVIEILLYALVAALVVRFRRALLPSYSRPVPKGLLMAWPVLALVSFLWSLMPVYSLVRAGQLLVLTALALLVVRAWLSDRSAGERIWIDTLRLYVRVVTLLALTGFLLHPWLSEETVESGRFTWPGTHPGVASIYLGLAFLILVARGRSITGSSGWIYWARLLLFGAAIYLGQTRSVIGATLLSVGVALWFRGRGKPLPRYLAVGYYLVGLGLVVALATHQLAGYLSRGESVQEIASLTGRVPLWEFALGQFRTSPEWLAGFGYGAARVFLYPHFSWAGSAHSTWVELLLGIGIMGLVFAAADIVLTAIQLIRSQFFDSSNQLAIAMLAYLFLISFVSESLAIPGVGFGFLALAHVPALTQRGWWAPLGGEREPFGRLHTREPTKSV